MSAQKRLFAEGSFQVGYPTMKMQAWIVFIASSLASSLSWSEDGGMSPEYSRCEARAQSETPALMDCLDSEYKWQDKRLNMAYKSALTNLSPKKADELRKVQRAWLAYVEGQCGFLYDADDFSGSLDRLRAQYCQVDERAKRASLLESLVVH